MRQCFIHVGTHKTATTSAQHLLSGHPQELASFGAFYPLAGRPDQASAGHHNLAWEISRDRRFSPQCGDREALVREIAGTDRNVIISSEDFECSAHHAERFGKFIVEIQKLGIRVKLIVFFRNQIDYAESLYCTLVQLGFDRPFSVFCDEILETSAARWREWIFPFRYDAFITRLASFPDVEVIVRSYDDPTMGSPVLDFLSVIGLGDALLPLEQLPRMNRRPELSATVQHYLANQAGLSPDGAEAAAIDAFLHGCQIERPSMSLAYQIRFVEAFEKSNHAVREKYRLPVFGRMRRERLAVSAGPSLNDIFGPRLRAMVRSTSPSTDDGNRKSRE